MSDNFIGTLYPIFKEEIFKSFSSISIEKKREITVTNLFYDMDIKSRQEQHKKGRLQASFITVLEILASKHYKNTTITYCPHKRPKRTSLVVQWLRLHASSAGGGCRFPPWSGN